MANRPVPETDAIAIVGIGCRFPGGANSPDAFWRLMAQGVDAVGEVPPERWSLKEYYHPNRELPGKMYARGGGFLDRIDLFDPEFFGISPREASRVDPQHRLLLEVSWEALEDAGVVPDCLAGSEAGVFIGICADEYAELQHEDPASITAYNGTGGSVSIAANRISYIFDLRGPSVAVDTSCSSSLVAVHLACQSLWTGESSLAIAGGVNLMLLPGRTVAYSKASMLSPRGRCRAFDAGADGYVRSEGAGVVVLKPLTKALADRDPVYALILATGVNQDGRTAGLSLPNPEAQEVLLRGVYARAGVPPHRVQYVEAHGTGTPAGDPIEANSLGRVLGAGRPAGSYLRIGSVKTNIGHLEGAAGIAGLIKVALSLKHGLIPASLHFERPNPKIDFEGLQVRVPTATEPWPDGAEGAVAGVGSFGFGGTNSHIVLRQYTPPAPAAEPTAEEPGRAHVLPVSAGSTGALDALAKAYRSLLLNDPDLCLRDLGYTASVRRTHHGHRLAVVARTHEELVAQLDACLAGERRHGIAVGRTGGKKTRVVFAFAGNGPQWWAMGRQLLQQEAVFADTVLACDRLFRKYANWVLLDELHADEAHSRMDRTEVAQPALFAIQAGLVDLWRSWGVEPDAVVGHSVGEVAAAYTAGILSLDDAVKVISCRSRMQETTAGMGKMAAVHIGFEQAKQALAGYERHLSIAAINTPTAVTLSGEPEALEAVVRKLEAQQVFCRVLRLNYAFHSRLMEPLREGFLASAVGLQPRAGSVRFISTVTGGDIEGSGCGPEYWWENLSKPVLFAQAVDRLLREGHDLFLEVGPHPVLATYITECASIQGLASTVLPSLRRKEDDLATLLGSLGALYAAGYPVEWDRLYPRPSRLVRLPSYPWQGERHWNEPEKRTLLRGGEVHPLLGHRVESAEELWHGDLDKRLVTYLNDHRVQGSVIFPAAGFIEMGLAAAAQVFGQGPCGLDHLEIQKALMLQDARPPRVQLVVAPDRSFAVHSKPRDGSTDWRTHAKGQLVRALSQDAAQRLPLDEIRGRCPHQHAKQDQYREAESRNHQFGPTFQGVERVWWGEREALGEIHVVTSLEPELDGYQLHPAVLDACLQPILAVLPTWGDSEDRTTWLPVRIERVRFHARPGLRLYADVRRVKTGSNWISVNVSIADADGSICVDIEGLRLQGIDFSGGGEDRKTDELLYELRWQAQSLRNSVPTVRSADFLPGPQRLAEVLQAHVGELIGHLGLERYYMGLEPRMRLLRRDYIVAAFRKLGWEIVPGQRVSAPSLIRRFGILDQHDRLVNRLLQLLEEDGLLRRQGDQWEVCRLPEPAEPDRLWRQLILEYPAYHAELTLLGRCGRRVAGALTGAVEPLPLIFPEKSGTAEHLFDSAPTSRIYNCLMEEMMVQVVSRLPEGQPIRVVELGARTGGATSHLLPRLPAGRTEYLFTDVSNAFLSRAEQRFGKYPFVHYRLLDVERDPVEQGFEAHSFDIVVASNVLHAMPDLRTALANIQRLLASQGMLVLLEASKRIACYSDLVFGLLKAWWHFTDTDLRDYPLLTAPNWVRLLQEVGFAEVADVSDRPAGGEPVHSLILARAGRVVAAEQPLEMAPSRPSGKWLVLADEVGLARELHRRLRAQGQEVTLVDHGAAYAQVAEDRFTIDSRRPEDFEDLLKGILSNDVPLTGVIHCWSLDAVSPEAATPASLQAAEELGCLSVLQLVQALIKTCSGANPRLWLVTRGAQSQHPKAQPVALAQSPVWGLGRVIANEYPGLRCTLIDLSPAGEDGGSTNDEVRMLIDELFADDREEEILLRGGVRFVSRMLPAPLEEGTRARRRQELREDESFRLEVATPGVLESLKLRAVRRQGPAPGQVQIEVIATGLNFKDVLQAMGILSGEALEHGLMGGLSLGLECAGRVVAVGAGVANFRVGDEVAAFGRHCLGRYVTTPAELVVLKPAHLSFEEAATIPATFFTAYYALTHVGRLQKGERVLIHGAAGGVGLAAVQIVQQAAGEVFATAGTPEKREFLQALGVRYALDSRSLAFAEEIREITRGEGVHVVLNSLAGEAIPRSLSVLRPLGRFLEIGKRDLVENSLLGLRPFERSLSFHAIDVDQLLLHDPVLSRSLFRELIGHFERKEYHPLPYRVFPIDQAESAFRHMQQSRHIGKIVLCLQSQDFTVQREAEPVRFSERATYLVTGGLSGFGLAAARWLVEKGARHVMLVNRSGASTPEARAAVEAMRAAGAAIVVAQADVTREDQVAGLISHVREAMPPLRGVLHAAMVLDDGILLQLNRERFTKVTAPKMVGAWNLHVHTRDLPLDFFVLFSSITSMVGNRGQANYAAGNAFLDALASYRQALGLPALAVNWGALRDAGYVARHADVEAHLSRLGIKAFPTQMAFEALARLLPSGRSQVGVVDADWPQWARVSGVVPQRMAALVQKDGQGHRPQEQAVNFQALIRAAAPTARRQLVESRLCDHVASVLGTSASKLDLEKPITALGLDSLMAVDLQIRVERDTGVDIPVMHLLQKQSIANLAAYVTDRLGSNGQTDGSAQVAGENRAGGDGRPQVGGVADGVAATGTAPLASGR